jgi:hypothetical protein
MKSLFFLVLFLITIQTYQSKAQEIFYPEIEPLLAPEQKQELEKAVNILLKARGNENNANDIERKYSKLKKKGKTESWMEKTWEAKLQRIMAEKNYKIAYQTISSVYSNIITNGKYANASDKVEALGLDKDAKQKFEDSDNLLSKIAESTKETMEQTPNEEVENNLHEIHVLKLNGIGQQILALQKIIGVGSGGKETISKSDDDLAWEKAKKSNTIDAYYEYLNTNPRGRHMSEANELINTKEKESTNGDVAISDSNNDKNDPKSNRNNQNKNQNNQNKNSNNQSKNQNNQNKNSNNQNKNKQGTSTISKDGLVFKVQIAAAVSEISQWMLSIRAPGIKDIEMVKSGIWLKYMVGSFGSYKEAANYRDELRSHAPDAFIVVFSNGNQVSVTEEMKN